MRNDYSIGDVAKILKVTTRTLRHWDDIGLLSPQWRTGGDHRLYTEDDVQRGMDILIYRSVGIELKDIAVLLDAPSSATLARLRAQHEALQKRRADVDAMLYAVERLIEETEMDKNLSPSQKMRNLGDAWPQLQEEAHEKWGDSTEWAASAAVSESMGKKDWEEFSVEHEHFAAELEEAAKAGLEAGSEEAKEIVDKHCALIAQWYPVSRSKQVLLARMYCEDPRFDETYRGNADYLRQLIEAQAQAEGLDLDNLVWD
ncbi:MerR family transcriptional regulator [Corynebacterium sp. HMSC068H04]|uniref:MerR family transcriptional regulator n=1 Tax=Corynebacterium sp. HMSC068H04 TaxID=1739296 RepID=UPI0008A1AB79|nr:MerR family transcriptional regulator [Corynebacterium sp. HMSC068H04]OFK95283.1 MerR family transcriptional regulator [Corynebacterium sp. HMSC068H04]